MKSLFTLILLFCLKTAAFAQSTFIKALGETNYGSNMRIIPTPDEGWVLFSLDSVKLYKFNKCGNIEWAKKYQIKQTYPGDFIKTKNGNFLYLTRIEINPNVKVSLLTMLNSNGNVLWSKSYEENTHSQVPYTIFEDHNGNFFLYCSAAPVGGGLGFRTIIKLNPAGNILWSKFYNGLNQVWGGAIVTSDNGLLFRAGSQFIKTDNNGSVQWVSVVPASSNEPYFAPLEVSDGYIFTGYRFSAGMLDFFKLDKQGNLVGAAKKTIHFVGSPPHLQKKSNGNIVGVFQQTHTKFSYPTIVEFDKDLNIIRQNALKTDPLVGELTSRETGIMADNSVLVAGIAKQKFVADYSALFVARTNPQLLSGCDTTGIISLTTEPAGQSTATATVTNHTFTTVNHTVVSKSISTLQTTICNGQAKRTVNIRQNTTLCESGTLEIKDASGQSFDSYLWSTGEKTASISVKNPGQYWLKAGYNCNSEFTSDTVHVQQVDFPQPRLTTDSALCNSKPVFIDAAVPNGVYRWHDGSTNPYFYATSPGNYFVDITVNNCQKRFTIPVSEFEKLEMPNIITPNSDERNESLRPIEYCGIAAGTLKIYNRWGVNIFETSDLEKGWNGMATGKKVSSGVYYYMLQYRNFRDQQRAVKGWVEVVED